jgi:hypothetical protein
MSSRRLPFSRPRLVRNLEAGHYFERFLVSGVAAMLAIRLYLRLSGYPQVGGHGLHIAHMLWGGLLMALAIGLLLGYVGRARLGLAAIMGGVGFGTFIDELGKFITSDNDYFFRPAVALIYAVFVGLFLLSRALEHRRAPTPEEALANGLDVAVDALAGRCDPAERDRALALLARAGGKDPLARELVAVLARANISEDGAARWPLARLERAARLGYHRVVESPWFDRALVSVFVLRGSAFVLALLAPMLGHAEYLDPERASSVADWIQLAASVAASSLVVVGIVRLPRSRLAAYHWFKRSTLVSVFLVQPFTFYTEQLGAVAWLAVDLALLVGLNYAIRREQAHAEAAAARVAAPELAPAPGAPRAGER